MCQKSPSDMILSYRMLVVEEIIQEEGLCTTEKNKEKKRSRFYDCCVPHCLETFDSTSALEEHYEKNHVHQCHECHRIFPNEYLLDLHLQETHDAYYQTLVQHGKTTYPCLVQNCPVTFDTLDQRMDHLQTAHGYPKWFRFHPRLSRSRRRCKKAGEKSKRPWWNKHSIQTQSSSTSTGMEMMVEEEEEGGKDADLEKKRRRSARRKERNKDIPCRYYNSPRGCWRGDKCMFLHERRSECSDDEEEEEEDDIMRDKDSDNHECAMTNGQSQEEAIISNADNVDTMQVEDILVDQVEKSMKISVPAKISFGRRRR